jgi:hypothetical protein
MLRGFTFKKPFDDLIRDITGFYEQKILLYQQMGDICSSLIAGPQPNVDYAKVAAEAPKITARLSFIDHSLFQATPFIFATLISETPDSHNQMSHLNITKAERDKLVHSIDSYFGKKLNKANQNYTVSAAWVLKEYLTTKGYKCSDEP